jgi:hypothetical protein
MLSSTSPVQSAQEQMLSQRQRLKQAQRKKIDIKDQHSEQQLSVKIECIRIEKDITLSKIEDINLKIEEIDYKLNSLQKHQETILLCLQDCQQQAHMLKKLGILEEKARRTEKKKTELLQEKHKLKRVLKRKDIKILKLGCKSDKKHMRRQLMPLHKGGLHDDESETSEQFSSSDESDSSGEDNTSEDGELLSKLQKTRQKNMMQGSPTKSCNKILPEVMAYSSPNIRQQASSSHTIASTACSSPSCSNQFENKFLSLPNQQPGDMRTTYECNRHAPITSSDNPPFITGRKSEVSDPSTIPTITPRSNVERESINKLLSKLRYSEEFL